MVKTALVALLMIFILEGCGGSSRSVIDTTANAALQRLPLEPCQELFLSRPRWLADNFVMILSL